MPSLRLNFWRRILAFLVMMCTVHRQATSASPECTTTAWVRAPDLVPNTIVQGDARVQVSAECPVIDSVVLGLRFKERSFVKALRSREDAKLLISVVSRPLSSTSSWSPPVDSGREAREELLANEDSWIIREEERMVFETTQPFYLESRDHGILRDTVHDFAILVPSTNFPPALCFPVVAPSNHHGEIIDVEWIYEYFVQVSFCDGTREEIFAGFTAFQPVHDPDNAVQMQGVPETMKLRSFHGSDRPVADYSVEFIDQSGLTFYAGAKGHVVHAILSRTGIARAYSGPLNVRVTVMPELTANWAAVYGVQDVSWLRQRNASIRRATMTGSTKRSRHGQVTAAVTVNMPNSTLDEIEAKEIVTTSARFAMPIELDDTHMNNFETYYRTLSNLLSVVLKAPAVEDGGVDPDDPFLDPAPVFQADRLLEKDEGGWVRGARQRTSWLTYSGQIPIVVHPSATVQRCLPQSTIMPDQMILSSHEPVSEPVKLTHYLEKGARGPIFVDPYAVPSLLVEDPAKRALRTPILEPAMSSPTKGEELAYRYHERQQGRFVGEAWDNKMASSGQQRVGMCY